MFSKTVVPGLRKLDVSMEDPVFIAVMGMTGSGKSSFINRVSGRKSVSVGHGLDSCKSRYKAL
jgi:ABC-type uncharacterized transport system ATPase component